MAGDQLKLFETGEIKKKRDISSTFADNMKLPIHRWFRFTAGFSAGWVNSVIKEKNAKRVFDPFAGSGTVPLVSEFSGVESIGVESHPYIYRIAKAKLNWKVDHKDFRKKAREVLTLAKKIQVSKQEYPVLIKKCFTDESAKKLESLKTAWLELNQGDPYQALNWLIITSILRSTSSVGTAQWQYVLPNKTKGKILDPYHAFEMKIEEMAYDMYLMQQRYSNVTESRIFLEDARNISSVPEKWADLVVTSPPYANNYDYADATRLEMTFWGDIEGWGELQDKVRKNLVIACTQHAISIKDNAQALLQSELLYPIISELTKIFNELSETRLSRGGKKNYHLMILAYFHDLAKVFKELRRVTTENSTVCFVVGDSAPYGVYVPVDDWLGRLAVAAGFESYNFEKTRDRNVKWKNRKHRVPLKEGRLWING
ncbi:MAG: site-specific DNA-methyltransferase [Bacteroidales bacterium]|nr:site-specific DNA-methyltransferase [Bacteroidales bacterium]